MSNILDKVREWVWSLIKLLLVLLLAVFVGGTMMFFVNRPLYDKIMAYFNLASTQIQKDTAPTLDNAGKVADKAQKLIPKK